MLNPRWKVYRPLAVATLALVLYSGPSGAFEFVDESRQPELAMRIGSDLKGTVEQLSISGTVRLVRIEDIRPPHKVQVYIKLAERIREDQVVELSRTVRRTVGSGYRHGFVSITIGSDQMYWVRADSTADGKVDVTWQGIPLPQYIEMREAALSYKAVGGEVLAAGVEDAPYNRQVIIINRHGKTALRAVYGNGAAGEERLRRRGERLYTDLGEGSYYLITRSAIQLFVGDGLVNSFARLR